jgi:hypothetical protein
VDTVDQAIEILTGIKAGEPTPDGDYEPSTVHGRVRAKLNEMGERLATFASRQHPTEPSTVVVGHPDGKAS